MPSDRPTKSELVSRLQDAELLLRALRCGAAAFDTKTGEFRCMGMRHSSRDTSKLLDSVSRCNLVGTCDRCEKKGPIYV